MSDFPGRGDHEPVHAGALRAVVADLRGQLADHANSILDLESDLRALHTRMQDFGVPRLTLRTGNRERHGNDFDIPAKSTQISESGTVAVQPQSVSPSVLADDMIAAGIRVPGGSIASVRALQDVASERMRQIFSEGHTPAQDDFLADTQLATLALRYINSSSKTWRRNLVIAAALLLAEIERVDRAAGRVADA